MAWIKAIPPKQVHDMLGVYHGQWMPEMDRCWIREEDGTMVCSRLVKTKLSGLLSKVEHVTITRNQDNNFTWADKQQIKDELFGKNRTAVEVFPKESKLVDVMNVYHLWVFDKNYNLPFGIHPSEYESAINRGVAPLSQTELTILKQYYENKNK